MSALRAELADRWNMLGQALRIPPPALRAWRREGRRLVWHWNLWPRRYHGLHHLAACLRHADPVSPQLSEPQAVLLALWFHDAIYWPWSPANETRSAAWAHRFILHMGLGEALAATVRSHVLDTRHAAVPAPGDAQWVVDIDLAVLGQSDAVYRQFERDVRAEYRFVRWPRYVQGRSAVLAGFLARERIYATDTFHHRLESQARTNLRHALDALARGEIYG